MTSLKVRMRVPPTTELCPNCHGQMTVIKVTPILSSNGLESLTYKCTKCRSELERTLNPPVSKPLWQRGGFERVC
jgi:transposase-like protein